MAKAITVIIAKETVEQIIRDINILERNTALENSEKTLFFLNFFDSLSN